MCFYSKMQFVCIFSLFSFLNVEKAYKTTMLCVSIPILTQLTVFQETWYEYYSTGSHLNVTVLISFLTYSFTLPFALCLHLFNFSSSKPYPPSFAFSAWAFLLSFYHSAYFQFFLIFLHSATTTWQIQETFRWEQ